MSDVQVPPAPQAAPRKRMSGWAIAGLIALGLVIVGHFSETDSTTTATVPVSSGTVSGLVDYNGYTVNEAADVMEGDWVDTMCSIVPAAGYDYSRQSFLEAEPQLGSDTFEGALFDELMARC